jgi:hypothetical protein
MNVLESALTFSRSHRVTQTDLPITISPTRATPVQETRPPNSALLSFAEAERDAIILP